MVGRAGLEETFSEKVSSETVNLDESSRRSWRAF